MSPEIQSSWMLSPKRFVSLLGAEYHLMRDSGSLRRFYLSGVLIVLIFFITGISFKYALDLLFHIRLIEIILAAFFSMLFFCIYIFLLNTFAKENRLKKNIFSTSNIIRIGFVAFMGFLVAQPLLILLFSKSLDPLVDNYRQQILYDHAAKIKLLVENEKAGLIKKQTYYSRQKRKFGTQSYDDELRKIEGSMRLINDKITALNQITLRAIEVNSFFLFRVSTVNRQFRLSWLFSLFIVLLFLLPGFLVYTMPTQHEYFQLKRAQEKELVMAAYAHFTARYQTRFNGEIFSRFEDPPFNQVRKQLPTQASTDDFLQKYLSNG